MARDATYRADGTQAVNIAEDNKALIVYEDGTTLYVCKAAMGAAASDDVWQIKKIDTESGVVVTWCDGNEKYDNTATDLSTVAGHTFQ